MSKTAEIISGTLMDDAILLVLQNNDGPLSYGDTSREARKIIDNMHPNYLLSRKQYPAFDRAVKRLINQGKIKLSHRYTDKLKRYLSIAE